MGTDCLHPPNCLQQCLRRRLAVHPYPTRPHCGPIHLLICHASNIHRLPICQLCLQLPVCHPQGLHRSPGLQQCSSLQLERQCQPLPFLLIHCQLLQLATGIGLIPKLPVETSVCCSFDFQE